MRCGGQEILKSIDEISDCFLQVLVRSRASIDEEIGEVSLLHGGGSERPYLASSLNPSLTYNKSIVLMEPRMSVESGVA